MTYAVEIIFYTMELQWQLLRLGVYSVSSFKFVFVLLPLGLLEAEIFNHLFIIFIYFNLFAHLLPSLLHTFHHKTLR